MKILKVIKKEEEIYRLGERAETHPMEFVKDIIYKDGNYTVVFSDNKDWFKTFTSLPCEYIEFGEMDNKSNKERFQ